MKDVKFEITDDDGNEGLLIYSVPDETVISENDAEYDAETASMEAGTYPPRFARIFDRSGVIMPHPVDRCQECSEPYYYHNDTWHTFVTPTGFCAHCQHNSEETRCFICGRTGHEIARQRHLFCSDEYNGDD